MGVETKVSIEDIIGLVEDRGLVVVVCVNYVSSFSGFLFLPDANGNSGNISGFNVYILVAWYPQIAFAVVEARYYASVKSFYKESTQSLTPIHF